MPFEDALIVAETEVVGPVLPEVFSKLPVLLLVVAA